MNNYQNHYQNYLSSKIVTLESADQSDNLKSSKTTDSENTVDSFNLTNISLRLLIDLISWSNSIQCFKKLNSTNQIYLLTSSWSELFVFTLAKSDFSLSDYIGSLKKIESTERIESFLNFHKVIDQIRQLNLTNEEYNYLRAIIIFETSKL